MSAKRKEFPRDLRGFVVGGIIENPDGSQLVLFSPVQSYDNMWAVRRQIERQISDPKTSIERKKILHNDLASVIKDLATLKKRILDYLKNPCSGSKDRVGASAAIDTDAYSKVEKTLSDIEAGKYSHGKKSKTLKAVYKALAYAQRNGRMPSHSELMELGFNDQQATDAGKWLEEQNHPHPHPLFPPLHKPKQGRPPKKK